MHKWQPLARKSTYLIRKDDADATRAQVMNTNGAGQRLTITLEEALSIVEFLTPKETKPRARRKT